ncbi:unnamed protein product [Camellia sinensis]
MLITYTIFPSFSLPTFSAPLSLSQFVFFLFLLTMEFGASFWYKSLPTPFCILFFSFTVSFTLFSLLLFILRLIKPWCNCEICRSYVTQSWSSEFDNFCDWYTHLLRKSPTGTIHVHVLSNTITANPENVEHILKTRFENYPKGKSFSAILGDLLGKGIFNVDGDSWKFQRKMASLELGSVSIRSYAFEIVSLEIQTRLIPLLSAHAAQKGNILDLQDGFRRFSFDNISMAASPLIWKLKRALNLGTEKKLKQAMKIVDLLAEEMIKNRRKMGFSTQKDLLSRFMGTIDDDQYLRDIVISFLVAGRDTVASGLTSFFWLLAQHPEVEKAIRDESDRVMGPVGQSGPAQELSSFDQMREMYYLQAAIYESMRPYPPVQFDSKFCEEDDTLPDGTFVRKGTRVTYHPYAMGRMERVWGLDHLKFKPERWLQSSVFTPVSPFKYPGFSGRT